MILTRIDRSSDGIFGQLQFIGETNLHFLTLEHAYKSPTSFLYQAKIPEGIYTCVRGIHILEGMKDPFETFEITNVPGHSNLLFHMGNFNANSEGCILLGDQIASCQSGRMITDSDLSFAQFMRALKGVLSFQLIIHDMYV